MVNSINTCKLVYKFFLSDHLKVYFKWVCSISSLTAEAMPGAGLSGRVRYTRHKT
jgi:hypothetical protein